MSAQRTADADPHSTNQRARWWVVAGLLAFVAVLAPVVRGDNALTGADADVIAWVAGWRGDGLVDLAHVVSMFGDARVLAPLVAIAAAVMLWWRRRAGRAGDGCRRPAVPFSHAFYPAVAFVVAACLNPLAKLIVGRPRPPAEFAEAILHTTGYPSGHSAQSSAAWVAVALAVTAAAGCSPAARRRWLAAAGVIVVLVGLSRVVLGVHSPTDVLGGWAFGTACALAIALALGVVGRQAGARRPTPAATGSGRE